MGISLEDFYIVSQEYWETLGNATQLDENLQEFYYKLFNREEMKKEIKVYVLNCDSDSRFRDWEQRGDYDKIKDKAEELGTIYSLKGFQDAINDGDLSLENSFILID